MLLAALLLKIGGYGLIMFSPLIAAPLIKEVLVSVAIPGAAITAFLCTRQPDLKTLIAYSSVRHIGMALAVSLNNSLQAVHACLVILISHGLTSSGLFFGAATVYLRTNSRNQLLNKRTLASLPYFSLL